MQFDKERYTRGFQVANKVGEKETAMAVKAISVINNLGLCTRPLKGSTCVHTQIHLKEERHIKCW